MKLLQTQQKGGLGGGLGLGFELVRGRNASVVAMVEGEWPKREAWDQHGCITRAGRTSPSISHAMNPRWKVYA